MKAITSKIAFLYVSGRNFLFREADPVLLLFLLLVANYRFSLKVFAIVAMFVYRPNFRFKKSGVFYFYGGLIALSLINLLLISGDVSFNHSMVVLAGCLIWLACGLVFHQVMLSVEKNAAQRTINTLKLISIVNFLSSIFDLVKIMLITHTVNPYSQESPPPYGISSGDLIGGIFGEMHLVNMSICFMLLLFFLYRRNFFFSFLCLVPFLLTGSNFGSLLMLATLIYLLIFNPDRLVKYYSLIIMAIILVFYAKVTPHNYSYLASSLSKVKTQVKPTIKPRTEHTSKRNAAAVPEKSAEEIKNEKIWKYIDYKYPNRQKGVSTDSVYVLKENYHQLLRKREIDRTIYTFRVKDSISEGKKKDKRFDYGKLQKFDLAKESGKITSFKQTGKYLGSDWRHLLFGAGPGGFSSRLAYITSGIVDDSRILMAIPAYENPSFTNNHKAIFKYLMFLDDSFHSVTNLPFSWYNELLGEYGLLGFLLFSVCYLGFFIRRFRALELGRVLLVLVLVLFLFDYWYQRLSVVPFFELLMLLDLKLKTEKTKDA